MSNSDFQHLIKTKDEKKKKRKLLVCCQKLGEKKKKKKKKMTISSLLSKVARKRKPETEVRIPFSMQQENEKRVPNSWVKEKRNWKFEFPFCHVVGNTMP